MLVVEVKGIHASGHVPRASTGHHVINILTSAGSHEDFLCIAFLDRKYPLEFVKHLPSIDIALSLFEGSHISHPYETIGMSSASKSLSAIKFLRYLRPRSIILFREK